MKRKSVFAYQGWYPSSKSTLFSMINNLDLNDIDYSIFGHSVKAIISPHAGYFFSLKTACYPFRILKGKKFDNVFILGPSHNSLCNGKAVLPIFEVFETPLGDLNVNSSLISNILNRHSNLFFKDDEIHNNEHSIEMQLPLIKYFLGEQTILPVILPPCDIFDLNKIGEALSDFLTNESLIVISSDLSHFPTKEIAEEIDKDAMNSWITLNPKIIWETEEKWRKSKVTSCSMCGISAIVSGVFALNKKFEGLQVELMNHSTSYDAGRDDRSVVGYGSAVIYNK